MDSGNGYVLMWHLLALSVPGFDLSIPVKLPSCIFNFALLFILYFWLQAKKGMVQDDCTCSTTFLNSTYKPMYADAIAALQLCITNYASTLVDGYLRSHQCLMGLANQINNNACTRAHAVIPCICRTLGMEVDIAHQVPIQGSPFPACLDASNRSLAPHWEGRGSGPRPSGNRPYVQGGRGSSCKVAPCGHYARPDRNGGAYQPGKICNACQCTGHVKANCNVLAIALFIEKYKRHISNNMKDCLESEWVKHWKDSLGNPIKKSCQVMKMYLDLMDISMDYLDKNMC
jgi:hypothetical protein